MYGPAEPGSRAFICLDSKRERVTRQRLSDEWANLLVQQHLGEHYTAHYLKASFVTIARANGADDLDVMN